MNTLTNTTSFSTSATMAGQTKFYQTLMVERNNKRILAIDLPGVDDNTVQDQILQHIATGVVSSASGVDVILLVISRTNRVSREDKNYWINWVTTVFGIGAWSHVCLVITGCDEVWDSDDSEAVVQQKQQQFITNSCRDNPEFSELFEKVQRTHLLVSNGKRSTAGEKNEVVNGLITVAERLRQRNGRRYTSTEFQEAQQKAREAELEKQRREEQAKKVYEQRIAMAASEAARQQAKAIYDEEKRKADLAHKQEIDVIRKQTVEQAKKKQWYEYVVDFAKIILPKFF